MLCLPMKIFYQGVVMKRKQYNEDGMIYGVMKFLVFIFVIVAIGIIILFATRLSNVTVDGSVHYSEEEIKEILISQETDRNTLLFYLRQKYKAPYIPFIEKIDVSLINRNTVQLQVHEKIITGGIEYMGSFMYFDREGIIVETSNEKVPNVPIVTGLHFNKLILHEKIEVTQANIFNLILNITQLINRYEIKANEINFTKNLEVILTIDNIQVLLGKRDSYDEQIAQLPNLLESIKEDEKLYTGNHKGLLIDMKEYKEGQDKIIATPIYQ